MREAAGDAVITSHCVHLDFLLDSKRRPRRSYFDFWYETTFDIKQSLLPLGSLDLMLYCNSYLTLIVQQSLYTNPLVYCWRSAQYRDEMRRVIE